MNNLTDKYCGICFWKCRIYSSSLRKFGYITHFYYLILIQVSGLHWSKSWSIPNNLGFLRYDWLRLALNKKAEIEKFKIEKAEIEEAEKPKIRNEKAENQARITLKAELTKSIFEIRFYVLIQIDLYSLCEHSWFQVDDFSLLRIAYWFTLLHLGNLW